MDWRWRPMNPATMIPLGDECGDPNGGPQEPCGVIQYIHCRGQEKPAKGVRSGFEKTLFFVAWITRDLQFLQWMGLRRGKHQLVMEMLGTLCRNRLISDEEIKFDTQEEVDYGVHASGIHWTTGGIRRVLTTRTFRCRRNFRGCHVCIVHQRTSPTYPSSPKTEVQTTNLGHPPCCFDL